MNWQRVTMCTVTVRDTSASPRAVEGPAVVTQTPMQGDWLPNGGGAVDARSAACQLARTSNPGVSACTIGYDTNPDAYRFVHGATRITMSLGYGGEEAHNPSPGAAVTLPLRIVHSCGEGILVGTFVLCDRHGNVVNGANDQISTELDRFGKFKSFSIGVGRVTLGTSPTCLISGHTTPVRLVFATTTFTDAAIVDHVTFAFGRGRARTAKHNPYVVNLKGPSGHHRSRVTLSARVVLAAAHGRHRTVTVKLSLRHC